MTLGVFTSLTAYFALMLAIGLYAWKKSTSSSQEYLLGGRALSPQVAALSAGASDMSGWLLLGLPGALFIAGLHEAWIGIGLWVGALTVGLWVGMDWHKDFFGLGGVYEILPGFIASVLTIIIVSYLMPSKNEYRP